MNNRSFDIIYWLNHHKSDIFWIAAHIGLGAFAFRQFVIGNPEPQWFLEFKMWLLGY